MPAAKWNWLAESRRHEGLLAHPCALARSLAQRHALRRRGVRRAGQGVHEPGRFFRAPTPQAFHCTRFEQPLPAESGLPLALGELGPGCATVSGMSRLLVSVWVAISSVHLACSDSPAGGPASGGAAGRIALAGSGGSSLQGASGSDGAGGSGAVAGSTGTGGASGASATDAGTSVPDAAVAERQSHLGKPFDIVNGVISADSNEYGLEASFYVVHNPKDTAVNVSTTTGQVCVNGALRRAVTGDFGSYQGLDIGFSVGPTQFRTLTETSLSIAPEAPAWQLDERVLGIAVTVTGLTPIIFGFLASPGGQDPGGQHGVLIDLTLFSTCNHPPITSSGQVSTDFFADMKNVWCIPEYQQSWTATSVSAFFWTAGSVVVDPIADGGVDDVTDPYDFCLSDIRPILAGAGPDEPGDPVSDAGAGGAADAGGEE